MFLASLLRRIAFSYYDYKAYNFNIEKTDFVVIHIPDQIGDAMAIFPVIRALELHKIKHLLIVTSTINLEVFNALKLEKTKLTLVTMTMCSCPLISRQGLYLKLTLPADVDILA
ncbi:hypothetical protein ACNIUU_25635, partial [Escherichia coli]